MFRKEKNSQVILTTSWIHTKLTQLYMSLLHEAFYNVIAIGNMKLRCIVEENNLSISIVIRSWLSSVLINDCDNIQTITTPSTTFHYE